MSGFNCCSATNKLCNVGQVAPHPPTLHSFRAAEWPKCPTRGRAEVTATRCLEPRGLVLAREPQGEVTPRAEAGVGWVAMRGVSASG